MQTRTFGLSILLLVLLAVGCNTNKNTVQKSRSDSEIVGTKWTLTTLEGQVISANSNQDEAIHFTLQDDGKVTGFAGCNTFNGTYTLEEGNRIKFDQMLSTLRACPDVDVDESAFLKVFELADNYTIDGDTLMLNVGRRAPLAVFEAVYF